MYDILLLNIVSFMTLTKRYVISIEIKDDMGNIMFYAECTDIAEAIRNGTDVELSIKHNVVEPKPKLLTLVENTPWLSGLLGIRSANGIIIDCALARGQPMLAPLPNVVTMLKRFLATRENYRFVVNFDGKHPNDSLDILNELLGTSHRVHAITTLPEF